MAEEEKRAETVPASSGTFYPDVTAFHFQVEIS